MKTVTLGILIIICLKTYRQDTIYWSQGYKLTWKDFQAKPDTSLHYEALTYSGIECSYTCTDSSFKYNVMAFFSKQNSRRMPKANNYALRREQIHFDISELFARKLKNKLSKYHPQRETVKKMMQELVDKIISEKENMQNQYDDETNFGRNAFSQQQWQRKINLLLYVKHSI